MLIQTYHQWLHLPKEIQHRFNLSECTRVPRINNTDAQPEKCLDNAERYIQHNGGKLIFGWMVTCLDKRVLRLVGHVIVNNEVHGDVCVSRDKFPTEVIAFSCDESIRKAAIETRYLPTRFIALSADKCTLELTQLETEIETLRHQNSVGILAAPLDNGWSEYVSHRRQVILNEILFGTPED